MKTERTYKVVLKKKIIVEEEVVVQAFTQAEAWHKAKELSGPDTMPKHHAKVYKLQRND
jgi:hypothetical protein